MLKLFTEDAGKYKAFSSVILDTMSLASAIYVITVPIPSSSKSEPPIVATHLTDHGLMSLNKHLSLTMWTLAALSTIDFMEKI